jgi:hypothetical protein
MNHTQGIRSNHRQFVICQINNFVCVARQGRSIAGDKMLVVANTNYQRTAKPCRNDDVWIVAEHYRQPVGAAKLGESLGHGVNERLMRIIAAARILGLFFQATCDQMRNHFGISCRLKDVTFCLQPVLQIPKVFDDAVMHQYDAAGIAEMRMCVLVGRRSVRGPARMADPHIACDRSVVETID